MGRLARSSDKARRRSVARGLRVGGMVMRARSACGGACGAGAGAGEQHDLPVGDYRDHRLEGHDPDGAHTGRAQRDDRYGNLALQPKRGRQPSRR